MRRLTPVVFVLMAACGTEPADRSQPPADPEEMLEVARDSVEIPEPPAARRGRLVAVSTGSIELSGSWPVKAGSCAEPAMLHLVAGEPGTGVIVVLGLPEAAERITRYPVHVADSGVSVPPSAQVGAQIQSDRSAHALQAVSGEVEIHSWGDRGVRGRLQVVLREILTERRVGFAASFDAPKVESLPPEHCRVDDAGVEQNVPGA